MEVFMSRLYKQGVDRDQESFLPTRVEDYVSPDNPVRAIDAYVRSLDLIDLGFANSDNYSGVGQRAYSPTLLLGLYLWGYLNRIHSSRRLELECKRNLELIWLVESLTPGYHTIADFRKNNSVALKKVNREFVALCKSLDLFSCELVAIDSAYFEGDASRESIYTKNKLKKLLEQIDDDIERYHKEIDGVDSMSIIKGSSDKMRDKIARLGEYKKNLSKLQKEIKDGNVKQVSLTDEDARLLSKPTDKGPTVGYAVQNVVDSKHKLIVTSEITVDCSDQNALIPALQSAKEILEVDTLIALADGGYYSGENIVKCENEKVDLYMPLPDNGKVQRKANMYETSDFIYDKSRDEYKCPMGKTLKNSRTASNRGVTYKRYRCLVSACKNCVNRSKCLSPKARSKEIDRSEFQDAVERHRVKMKYAGGEMMRKRSGIVEHPFGTLKLWLGWTHFLVRGIEKVKGEMALLTTAYNFKRVLNIIGVENFINACTA
jgi:transposase